MAGSAVRRTADGKGADVSEHPRLSGRQITIMVVAVCGAVVLAPVGVFAASRSSVSIADGTHPSRLAEVTKKGAQVVTVTGTPTVKVTNLPTVHATVTAVPGLPGKPFAVTATTASDTVSVTVPAGTHAVVQTISVKITVDNSVTLTGAEVTYTEAGVLQRIDFPTPKMATGDSDTNAIFGDTIPVTIYPDPGSTISVLPQFNSADLSNTQLTVSGYTTTS
jgi:hypothetical protein